MVNLINEAKRMQHLAGIITESQLNENIGDFNPTNFSARIKEILKGLGYEVKDMTGTSIDPAKSELEKAANEGKKSAVVGIIKWEDGEEVVAAVSINQKDDTGAQIKTVKELEDKIYKVYAKDFTARLNKTNNNRVVIIGIKAKQAAQPQAESLLNEDDTHLNKIARDLYSFLKKNGVNVVLSKTAPGSPAKTIGDMSKQPGMSRLDVTKDNTAKISVYPWKNNQTEIFVQLFGGQKPVEEVEKRLLTAYPGLEQFDRKGGYFTPLGSSTPEDIYSLYFRVKEKTTKKGGYVSNTPTNPKPSTQVAQAAESLDIDSVVNEALKSVRK